MSEFIDNIQPFLGRLVLEIVRDSADEHLKKQYESTGVSREFLSQFEIAGTKNKKTPIVKGRIVKKAPDAFGQAFRDRYGNDFNEPEIGNIVYFIPNETYRLDPNDQYHLVGDCDIVAYERGQENDR